MKNILLVAMTLFGLSAASQTKSIGKIQLQKGQKISVHITNMSDTELGMGMNLKNNTENTNVLTVMGETDKEYVLSNTLTKLKLSIEGMGQSQEFDSEKESDKNSEMGKALNEAIGKTVDVNVNKFNGSPVYNKADAGPEKPASNPVENMMSALGGDEPSVGGAFLLIPAGKKAGESWTEIDSTHEKKGTRVYTIKSISGEVAQLTFISNLAASTNLSANGMNMPMQMNIKSTGDITTDVTTGLVSKRNSASDISGIMEVQGQTLPITVKSNMNVVYTTLKK